MDANQARAHSYANNKLSKGVTEINKLIAQACSVGKFKIETEVLGGWGNIFDLRSYYERGGYYVSNSHKQTSPNDGIDYLYLNWEQQVLDEKTI